MCREATGMPKEGSEGQEGCQSSGIPYATFVGLRVLASRNAVLAY